MINYIQGVVKSHAQQTVIVESGAMGLALFVARPMVFELEKSVKIYTYLHWNQEQGPTLYGFENDIDRTIFLLVIGCAGIGPKIGLAVLAQLGSACFIEAIQLQDQSQLSKVSGIGARKAEQIIMQLRDKVTKLLASGVIVETTQNSQQWHMLGQALESLNYSRAEVAQVMSKLQATVGDTSLTFDVLMRRALSFLSK